MRRQPPLLHEYARIYHALFFAAREAEEVQERKLILRCLADESNMRANALEMSLRRVRIAHSLPEGTRFRRLTRWILLVGQSAGLLRQLDPHGIAALTCAARSFDAT